MTRPHTGIAVDLRRGVRYALARRKRLAAYLATIVPILVAQGVLHGATTLFWVDLGLGVLGGGVLHQVKPAPRLPAKRKG